MTSLVTKEEDEEVVEIASTDEFFLSNGTATIVFLLSIRSVYTLKKSQRRKIKQ
jgi:hypothetical protein